MTQKILEVRKFFRLIVQVLHIEILLSVLRGRYTSAVYRLGPTNGQQSEITLYSVRYSERLRFNRILKTQ